MLKQNFKLQPKKFCAVLFGDGNVDIILSLTVSVSAINIHGAVTARHSAAPINCSKLVRLYASGNTWVEHSPHYAMFEGLSLATAVSK